MTFRDLSYWGIVKITLIMEFFIPLLLLPFFLIFYLVAPQKVTVNISKSIDIWGLTVQADGIIGLAFGALIGSLIGLFISAAILYFFGQKTRLGHVKIGRI